MASSLSYPVSPVPLLVSPGNASHKLQIANPCRSVLAAQEKALTLENVNRKRASTFEDEAVLLYVPLCDEEAKGTCKALELELGHALPLPANPKLRQPVPNWTFNIYFNPPPSCMFA